MKRTLFLPLIACFAFSPVFSAPLEELVGPVYASQLKASSTTITETHLKQPFSLKLLPAHAQLQQFVSAIEKDLAPGLAVETLFLYKKPASAAAAPAENQSLGLFNQITALSSLAGIEYYSASRKTMRTFYEISHVIEGPGNKKPLPDPVFVQIPASLTVYARQKDLSFGDNVYRYEYRTGPDAVFFSQENMTAMSYGIIPAVGKHNLRSVLAVIDCGNSLLIYAVSMAKAASVPGMGDKIGSSFGNRAEALLKWFTNRANIVFLSD
jgi:hypothetical protein